MYRLQTETHIFLEGQNKQDTWMTTAAFIGRLVGVAYPSLNLLEQVGILVSRRDDRDWPKAETLNELSVQSKVP